MKKIVKLSEQDLIKIVKKIINEDDAVKCPPKVRVTKQLIDSKLSTITNEVNDWINGETLKKILNEMDSKYRKIVKNMLDKSIPTIIEINKKLAYANYGVTGQYNQTPDVINLVNNFYREIISEIEGNFITKNLMSAYINKNNIQSIKNMINQVLDKFFFVIRRITFDPFKYGLRFEIDKTLPKCSDGSKSYYSGDYVLADVKQLLVSQKNSISKLLDKYV